MGAPTTSASATTIVALELVGTGGRMDWEASGTQRLACDRLGTDAFYDVWIIGQNGSSPTDLTNGRVELPGFHTGNPCWRPTTGASTHLVFQSQRQTMGANNDPASPGSGAWNDLYCYRFSDSSITKIRTAVAPADASYPGVLHPKFNRAGTKLSWVEKVGAVGAAGQTDSFGTWQLMLADFSDTGTPALANVTAFTPGDQACFYECHNWDSADTGVLFTGNLVSGQIAAYLDIYKMTLTGAPTGTGKTRLTTQDVVWDEHAHYCPDQASILWSSNANGQSFSPLIGECWMMALDGTSKRAVSGFNVASSRNYYGGRQLFPADKCWAADGRRFGMVLLDNALPHNTGPIVICTTSTRHAVRDWGTTRTAASGRVHVTTRTAAAGRVAA